MNYESSFLEYFTYCTNNCSIWKGIKTSNDDLLTEIEFLLSHQQKKIMNKFHFFLSWIGGNPLLNDFSCRWMTSHQKIMISYLILGRAYLHLKFDRQRSKSKSKRSVSSFDSEILNANRSSNKTRAYNERRIFFLSIEWMDGWDDALTSFHVAFITCTPEG